MKIILSAGECLKLGKDFKAIAKLLRDSGEEVKDLSKAELVEKFKSKISLVKIQLDGSIVYEIDEEFTKDVLDIVNQGYFVEIIKNLHIIKPFVTFVGNVGKGFAEKTDALYEKWFADANTDERTISSDK